MPNKIKVKTKEIATLDSLMAKAVDKYSIDDLLIAFYNAIGHGYENEVVFHSLGYCKDNFINKLEDDIIKDNKESITDDVHFNDRELGYILLKIDGIEKRGKLDEFLRSEIYPFHNDQIQNLFN